MNFRWPGNVRQLKNVAEQMSIIVEDREVDAETMKKYLPDNQGRDLPVLYKKEDNKSVSERDLLYKVLFDMKKDINDLKRVIAEILSEGGVTAKLQENKTKIINELYEDYDNLKEDFDQIVIQNGQEDNYEEDEPIEQSEVIEESLSLRSKEIDLIKKALDKHKGKRKDAARELGISERTLYRKIKEYNIR
ncbi:MAG: helix-turn-helix domain-containing protein [Bacteroidota bacterium]|nr:helix-turn-helix domain-containing protein [Bacteroidota bacterium]